MMKDLVEQTTTTTGTGAYALDGAAPLGRRSFATAFSGADKVSYVVTDGTNFECGIGTLTADRLTLNRTIISASSNANAAVNWGAGEKRVYCAPHAATSALNLRHMVDAYGSSTPSAVNEESQGYLPGAMWVSGVGMWIHLGNGNWYRTIVRNSSNVVEFNDNAAISGAGALIQPNGNTSGVVGLAGESLNVAQLSTTAGFVDAVWSAETSLAGAVTLSKNGAGSPITNFNSATYMLMADVLAVDTVSGNVKEWTARVIDRAGTAISSVITAGFADAGTPAWTLTYDALGPGLVFTPQAGNTNLIKVVAKVRLLAAGTGGA